MTIITAIPRHGCRLKHGARMGRGFIVHAVIESLGWTPRLRRAACRVYLFGAAFWLGGSQGCDDGGGSTVSADSFGELDSVSSDGSDAVSTSLETGDAGPETGSACGDARCTVIDQIECPCGVATLEPQTLVASLYDPIFEIKTRVVITDASSSPTVCKMAEKPYGPAAVATKALYFEFNEQIHSDTCKSLGLTSIVYRAFDERGELYESFLVLRACSETTHRVATHRV